MKNPTACRCSRPPHTAAFTLIEMLAVIAIMVIIASFLAPTVGTILRGKEITRAANDIAGAIELARSEAMSKNTYVRIAFENAVVNGHWQLQVGAVRSLDGTLANTGSSNFRPVMKVQKFDNVALVNFSNIQKGGSGVADMLTSAAANGAPAIADDPMFAVKNVIFQGLTINNQYQALIITPQGEAISSAAPGTFLTQVLIGFRRTVGAPKTTTGVPTTQQGGELSPCLVSADPDKVALVFYGGTGHTRLFRLQ